VHDYRKNKVPYVDIFVTETPLKDICEELKLDENEYILSKEAENLVPVLDCLPGRIYYLLPRLPSSKSTKPSQPSGSTEMDSLLEDFHNLTVSPPPSSSRLSSRVSLQGGLRARNISTSSLEPVL
jgi:hypothetical protein